MDWVETTGRTVEEAKKLALEQLGVAESDAEFEVVSEPKIGLFGRLKEEARVRARVQPRYPRSKGERRDRRRARGAKQDQTVAGAQTGPVSTPEDEATSATPRKRAKIDENSQRNTSQPGTRRRRRTGGPGNSMDKSEERTSSSDLKAASADELARAAETFLRGLLNELGTTADVTSGQLADDLVEVAISGDGLGTLIGPKGATLLALQEITRIVLQRQSLPSDYRVVVDINGYRKRRQEALARFAQGVAAEVVASNKKRALEPMPPADRKIVHDAVNGIAGVTTVSEGEEPNRRVVLVPATDAEPASEPDFQGVGS